MTHDAYGRSIVVPIANPASARPLITVAARIAARDGGVLVPVTVVRPRAPADERAAAWLALADAEEVARELGTPVAAEVVEDEQVADGVLSLATRAGASLVVMGWRGRSSTTDVFGRLTDTIVGRSAIPLAIVRFGVVPFRRVVLPINADHLRPEGTRGLRLAVGLADRLTGGRDEPTVLLHTGGPSQQLPEELRDLALVSDDRRTDQAVAAHARPHDIVVAPVAPTATGLRAATTHLAWAAPDATLLVAVDVGPTRTPSSPPLHRTAAARPAEHPTDAADRTVRVIVTARLADGVDADPDALGDVLGLVGTTDDLMAWWPAGDGRPHVRATVTVCAASVSAAIAALMVAVHEAERFRGAELTYDIDRRPVADGRLTVGEDTVEVTSVGEAHRPRHAIAAHSRPDVRRTDAAVPADRS